MAQVNNINISNNVLYYLATVLILSSKPLENDTMLNFGDHAVILVCFNFWSCRTRAQWETNWAYQLELKTFIRSGVRLNSKSRIYETKFIILNLMISQKFQNMKFWYIEYEIKNKSQHSSSYLSFLLDSQAPDQKINPQIYLCYFKFNFFNMRIKITFWV